MGEGRVCSYDAFGGANAPVELVRGTRAHWSSRTVTGLLVLRVRISEPRRRWIIPDPGFMLMAFMNGKQSISSFLTLMLIKRLIQYYRVYSHILMS